eukprot:TCONS_00053279-protein
MNTDDDNIFGEDESSQLITTSGKQKEAEEYEKIVDSVGFGYFQWKLLFICGWALASDSTEVQVVSFVIPAACDLGMTSSEKGWLNGIIFVGMMIGGYVFGGAADIKGRRYVLLWSMTINGLFGLASSFAPTFGWFLLLRMLSGIGVGAAMPVLFSYFVEFMRKETRGRMITLFASFWMVGNIITSAIAWLLIPKVHIGGQLGSIYYGSWRIFVAVGSFPSLSSAVLFFFLPESPKFMMQNNQVERAKKAFIKIFKQNNGKHSSVPACILGIETPDGNEYNKKREISISDPDMCTFCQCLCESLKTLQKVLHSTYDLFCKPYTSISIILLFIWITLSFGYYGLWMWFPEIFKRIQEGRGGCGGATHHNMGANFTTFDNRTCVEKVEAETEIYFQSFLIALSNLPGNIICYLLIDRIGRRNLLAGTMVLSAVCVFFFWFVDTKIKMLIMSCFFSALSVCGWNALDPLALENYPTHLRSSAFGLQASVGRVAAILGNVVFGELVDLHCSIPLLLVAGMLALGGLSSLKLPKTEDTALT